MVIVKVEWASVKDFPYSVSTSGQVRNDRTGRILRPMRHGWKRKQYSGVELRDSGRRLRQRVHLLVLSAFRGSRPEGCIGMHLDDNTENNALSNLSWGSYVENARAAYRIPRLRYAGIQLALANGETGVAVARKFGLSQQRICDIRKGRFS